LNQPVDKDQNLVYEKQKELEFFGEKRINCLEQIIKQKVQQINTLESENRQYLNSCQDLQKLIDVREKVLSDYEQKFDNIRVMV
jgi:hypothetical protein